MKVRLINIVSVIILTISAVIGLVFDFKNEEGTITFWGYLSISITIISGITAVITEILEHFEQKKEKEQIEVELKNRLLRDIHSPVNSIANNAVHELRALKKLIGDDSWTQSAKLGGKADLSNARLYDANFNGTSLYGANLSESDLRNVDFRNADLTGVNLFASSADKAKYNENTILPDGVQWCDKVDIAEYTTNNNWQEVYNWLENIKIPKDLINIDELLQQKATIRNVIIYLIHKFPNSDIDIAEDELHFLRHYKALDKSNYETVKEIDDLLFRTEEARKWVWQKREIPYLIVHISYSIALENPKHMNLVHWTEETIERVKLARKKFFNID